MKILHVASEVAPFSQTGGLADVAGALPAAESKVGGPGVEIATLSPAYRSVLDEAGQALRNTGITLDATVGATSYRARILESVSSAHFFVDCPELYNREGIYGPPSGGEYWDNGARFAVLSLGAVRCGEALMGGAVDLLHAHDWQAALVPIYLRDLGIERAPKTVFTVHNLRHQGVFDKSLMTALGLSWSLFTIECLEYHDQVNLLKGAIALAGTTTTVSPSYAAEILENEFGCGLSEFLRGRPKKPVGILNGIDMESWDPARDPEIEAPYSAADRRGKAACRDALAAELGLTIGADRMLLGVVARFAEQKGLDLVAEIVPRLSALGIALAVLGSGDPDLERRFEWLATQYPDDLAVHIGFDLGLARRFYAGSDALAVPSRFEPCGLTQLYAMRYGAVPIVNAVGGLRDTVADELAGDGANGFVFEGATTSALESAVARAALCFRARPAAWRTLQETGMREDRSWARAAREYLEIYRALLS